MPKKTGFHNRYYIPNPEVEMDDILKKYINLYKQFENTQQKFVWLYKNHFYPNFSCESNIEMIKFYESWKDKYLSMNKFILCSDFFKKYPNLYSPFFVVDPFENLSNIQSILEGHDYCISIFKEIDTFPNIRIIYTDDDRSQIQAALNREIPFKWLYGLYLFGNQLWELSKSEAFLTDEELRYLFLETFDKERRKFERLRKKYSGIAGDSSALRRKSIPEEVRIFVWRRDEGRCVNCESKERLEYDHIIPVSKGGSNTARNIQLLCEHCNRKKSNKIE